MRKTTKSVPVFGFPSHGLARTIEAGEGPVAALTTRLTELLAMSAHVGHGVEETG